MGNVSFFSKCKNFFLNVVTRLKSEPMLLFLISMLLINLVLGMIYLDVFETKRSKEQQIPTAYKNVPILRVVNAYVGSGALPSQFTLQFNDTVDIHELDHTVVFSPKVEGKWELDAEDPTVFHYKFDKKFKDTYFSVQVSSDLRSLDGDRMDRVFDQYYTIQDNNPFSQDARVKSFAAGEAIPFIYDSTEVTVYKSDAQKLLSYLTYTLSADVTRGSVYDGTFLENSVEHADSDKLKTLNINIEEKTLMLDPGVYYIDDNTDKPFFVVVSNYGAVLRQDDQKIVLGAFNLQSGRKLDDAVTFGLYNLKGKATLLKDFVYTNENSTIPFEYPARLDAMIGIYKNEVFFIPVEVLTSFADIQVSSNLDTDTKIFLYTDRPIYQPGDTVFVKGIARQDSDGLYKLPTKGTKVYVRLNTYGTELPEEQIVSTDEYGAFHTNFMIPEEYKDEYSGVSASTRPFEENNYSYFSADFSILKYVKPEFEIKTSVEKTEYLQSDKLAFTVSGNYFDGQPLVNKEINYEIYSDTYYEVEKAVYNQNFNIGSGGMCGGGNFGDYFGRQYKTGTVILNSDGKAVVQTDWDKESTTSQKVTLVAKIVDTNINEIISAATTIVHSADFNIFFIPSADRYSQGEEVVVPFYAESLNGEKVKNAVFTYKLVSYDYSGNNRNETITTSGETITDETGKGIVKFILPEDSTSNNYKELQVRGVDAKNNFVQNQKPITIVEPDTEGTAYNSYWGRGISQTYLKIHTNQNAFKVGETVTLNITSPKELDVLLSLERGRIYKPQLLHLNRGENSFEFQVDSDLSPSITAVFSFFTDGSYYTEGLSLNVPAMHKLLTIDLSLDKSKYTTADKNAELKISTRDANGVPVAAQMSVGIVDKAIYALRQSATPKIHSSYYYFRSRRTNASSSLTKLGIFEGGGGGGGGGESMGKAADVLYWNPTVKTDISGETALSIPLLGYETTWKVQVLGSTLESEVGQADTEFIVTDIESP